MPGTKHFVVVPLGLIVCHVRCKCHCCNLPYHNHMYLTFILTRGLSSHNTPHALTQPVLLSEDSLFGLLVLILEEDGTAARPVMEKS